MTSHDEAIPPEKPPRPDLTTPENQARLAFIGNRNSLHGYVREFEATISLFSAAPGLTADRLAETWQMIAAKQGIVCAFNFSMALKGVRSQANNVPALQKYVSQIDATREAFKLEFPDIKELRQTVLHQGEKHWDPKRNRENSTRGPTSNEFGSFGGPVAMSACLAGNVYIATFSGREVRFEMSERKADALRRLHGRVGGIRVEP